MGRVASVMMPVGCAAKYLLEDYTPVYSVLLVCVETLGAWGPACARSLVRRTGSRVLNGA